jgi:hypothetical protein
MKYFLGGILATLFWLFVLYLLPVDEEGRYYDCRMAEFHPDYPREVREQCRLIMSRKATIT